MLPNKRTVQQETINNQVPVQSSEPHIVVACPSCRTKFAVEGSLVASFEVPRFHCSRCDSVFELPTQSAQTSANDNDSTPKRWILSEEAPPTPQPERASKPKGESTIAPSDFTLGSARNTHEVAASLPDGPIEERSGLSLLGLNLSATWLSPAAITRNATRAHSKVAPTAPSISSDPFSLFDPPLETASDAAKTTRSQIISAQTPSTPPTAKATTSNTAQRSKSSAKVAAREEINPPSRPEIDPVLRKGLFAYGRPRLSHRNYSLTVLSTPLVIATLVLSLMGYSSRFIPQTVDGILSLSVPSILSGKIANLPPPELSVRDLSLQFVKTQSRETVGVVRGFVFNGSSRTLDDVQLEALGFNDRGEIVARAQAPLRSALAREKISDLPLATVKKFQESLSARSSIIAAGEKVAFTIAFVQTDQGSTAQRIDLAQIKYFSARVFSVGN